MNSELKTLTDAIRYFDDEQVCIDTVAAMRWPDGPQCPVCLMPAIRQHWLKNQKRWQCRDCGKQYSVKVNTIFEDSPIKLDKWLTAMWLMANCKNGVSSYEIARSLASLRSQHGSCSSVSALRCRTNPFSGLATLADPSKWTKPTSAANSRTCTLRNGNEPDQRSCPRKTIVMGMLDRKPADSGEGDSLRAARCTPKRDSRNMHFSTVRFAHDLSTLADKGREFVHETVNHVEEYVRGQVHTQGIENFWSLLKRGLNGTYVAVEPFHLSRYVDEQAFRFNNRSTKDNPLTDADRFALALSQISGKRLTYAELTGKVRETPC